MTKKRDKRPSGAGIAFDFSRDGTDSSVVAYTGLTRYKPFSTCPAYIFDVLGGRVGGSINFYGQPYTSTTFIKKIEVYANVVSTSNDCCYYTSFVNGDLVAGKLSVQHNLNEKYVFVEVFVGQTSSTHKKVIPDEIQLIDSNNLDIDFSSFTTDPNFLFYGADVIIKCVGDSSKGGYTNSFVDGDLTSDILQVTHSLGEKYVFVEVYDDNDRKIIPDEVQLIDSNTLEVDLSSFTPITGTWNVLVKNCVEPTQTVTYQLIDSVSYSSPTDLDLYYPHFVNTLANADEYEVFVYTNNRTCDQHKMLSLGDPVPPPDPCCYEMTFTDANLQQDLNEDSIPDFDLDGDGDGDLLIVPHQRGHYVFIEVYDENDKKIIPNDITYSGFDLAGSNAAIDLRSFTPISDTWKVIVMCCSTAPFPDPA